MKRRNFNSSLLALASMHASKTLASNKKTGDDAIEHSPSYYRIGDKISAEIFVKDKNMKKHRLVSIMDESPDIRAYVLFIFGGGSMGHASPGGIWCPDSFEDLHILRTLCDNYKSYPLGYIPVACAPVFHTKYLGYQDRLFFDAADSSPAFKEASKIFIESTQDAFKRGIIPVQPYYDLRLRLMLTESMYSRHKVTYGNRYKWEGMFRVPEEDQRYGIPNFWIVDRRGVILDGPFRGNMYHPKAGDKYQQNYTVKDIGNSIEKVLQNI